MAHTVGYSPYLAYWNALVPPINAGRGWMVNAVYNSGPGVGVGRWIKKIGLKNSDGSLIHSSAGQIVQKIDAAFDLPASSRPARVVLDELSSTTARQIANVVSGLHGRHRGKWGAYIVNGPSVDYYTLRAAIIPLLDADALLLPEFYPFYGTHSKSYLGSGSSTAARDNWLAEFFTGYGFSGHSSSWVPNSSLRVARNRLGWLMHQRAARGSTSPVVPVFGVRDYYLNRGSSEDRIKMLDRMFYVWRVKTGFHWLIFDTNHGGVGAYKWAPGTHSARDSAFKASFEWYCTAANGGYRTTSRKGVVPNA